MVQKNCSGLIPKALQIHTAGISACSLLGGGTLKKKKKRGKKVGLFLDAFINGGTGLSIEALPFVGLKGGVPDFTNTT